MQNTDLTEKNITLWNVENLLSYINIGKISTFEDIEIEKNFFYSNRIPILLKMWIPKKY